MSQATAAHARQGQQSLQAAYAGGLVLAGGDEHGAVLGEAEALDGLRVVLRRLHLLSSLQSDTVWVSTTRGSSAS